MFDDGEDATRSRRVGTASGWRESVRVGCLVCLLVIAGCSAPTSEETRTVDPALEGTPSPTPVVPPGIGTEAVDAGRLADAHQRLLRTQSRTVRRATTVRDTNGTLLGRNTAFVRANRESVRIVGETAGQAPATVGLSATEIDFWTNGTVVASRQTSDNATRYGYRGPPLPPGPLADTTGHSLVEAAFSAVQTTTVQQLAGDRVRIRGSAGRADARRNVSLVATVTGTGVVEQLRVSYTRLEENRTLRVVRTLRVSGVEATTVPKPDWLATAQNATMDDNETTGEPTATDQNAVTDENEAIERSVMAGREMARVESVMAGRETARVESVMADRETARVERVATREMTTEKVMIRAHGRRGDQQIVG